jgi:uncharacterized cupredoxin-like copper-binding protein
MALFLLPRVLYHGAMVKLIAKRSLLFVPMVLLLALVACASGESAAQSAEPLTLTIKATDIAYDMTHIEGQAHRAIKLTLDNQGVLEHDFNIAAIPLSGDVTMSMPAGAMGDHDMGHMADPPDLHVAASPGRQGMVEFIPSTPGEYTFYCTVPGHREVGMEGVLVIK